MYVLLVDLANCKAEVGALAITNGAACDWVYSPAHCQYLRTIRSKEVLAIWPTRLLDTSTLQRLAFQMVSYLA